MAKKKSKRFIIPSIHFLTTLPAQSTAPSEAIDPRPSTISQAVKQGKVQVKTPLAKPEKSEPAPPKETPRPAPVKLQSAERKRSALSLSSLKRNKEEEEERLKNKKDKVENTKELPNDPFTQETFIKVWTSYVEGLHGKGEKILASILKADAPGLRGNLIQLTYPNEMMKIELLKVKPKVLRHLKQALNNYSLDFEIHVNETSTKRFAYTPQEKYELLKEKNEAISLLRKTFNLEL